MQTRFEFRTEVSWYRWGLWAVTVYRLPDGSLEPEYRFWGKQLSFGF